MFDNVYFLCCGANLQLPCDGRSCSIQILTPNSTNWVCSYHENWQTSERNGVIGRFVAVALSVVHENTYLVEKRLTFELVNAH